MHYGNDKNVIFPLLIEDGVRKPAGKAASCSRGESGPCAGEQDDPAERCFYFCCKFISQAWSLFIVIIDGFSKFLFGDGEEAYVHFLLMRPKTAFAESAAICPPS